MDVQMDVKRQGERCLLCLEGELTIYDAAALKLELLKLQDESSQLEINLARVSEMDTAGFQLLYMLKWRANHEGKTLSLVAHSQATLEVIELFHMGSFFGDPLVITSAHARD